MSYASPACRGLASFAVLNKGASTVDGGANRRSPKAILFRMSCVILFVHHGQKAFARDGVPVRRHAPVAIEQQG